MKFVYQLRDDDSHEFLFQSGRSRVVNAVQNGKKIKPRLNNIDLSNSKHKNFFFYAYWKERQVNVFHHKTNHHSLLLWTIFNHINSANLSW